MRLQSTKLVMLLIPPAVLAYGWMCQYKIHVAGPIVALFVSGFGVL